MERLKPLTIFADLAARSDVLWDERILRAMRRCDGAASFECHLRGGALLTPNEGVGSVDFGPRIDGVRERTGYSEVRSAAFWETMVRRAISTTTPMTSFNTNDLLKRGLFDWDIFTLSHVTDDVLPSLLDELGKEAGFLHAARPDVQDLVSYQTFWGRLMFIAVVCGGTILRADVEDDPSESLRAGFCSDRMNPSGGAADGIVIDFYGHLMPEERFSAVPLPIKLQQSAVSRPPTTPIHHDAVTRAVALIPNAIRKSHKFDVDAEPAHFKLPSGAADRIADYWQVEQKVRDYCLRDRVKADGFRRLGFSLSDSSVNALSDQILACANSPVAGIDEPRVMSDGTLQFSQRLVIAGPRGYGAVRASWNIKTGRPLRLSSAYRADDVREASASLPVPAWWGSTADWGKLIEAIREDVARATCGFVASGRFVFPLVLIPAVADARTTAFARWAKNELAASVHTRARRKYLHIGCLVDEDRENAATPQACAIADALRVSGIRAYPVIEFN